MGDSYSAYQSYVRGNESTVKPLTVEIPKGLRAEFGEIEQWRSDTKCYDFGKVWKSKDGRVIEHQSTWANGHSCTVFQSENDWFGYRKLMSVHQYLHG